MCLIAAVPLNVICKLSDNQTPFPDCDATNQLIAAKNFDAFIQAAGLIDLPASPVSASGSTGLLTKSTQVWDDATNTHWTKFANICALSGFVAISAFAVLKAKFNQGWPGYAAAVGYGLCYFPYVAPDIIGVVQNWYQPKTNWYNTMNFGLATCGLIKSFVDIKLVKPASNPANVPNTSSTDPKVDSPNEQPAPNPAPPTQLPADQAPDPKWRKPFSDGDGTVKAHGHGMMLRLFLKPE